MFGLLDQLRKSPDSYWWTKPRDLLVSLRPYLSLMDRIQADPQAVVTTQSIRQASNQANFPTITTEMVYDRNQLLLFGTDFSGVKLSIFFYTLDNWVPLRKIVHRPPLGSIFYPLANGKYMVVYPILPPEEIIVPHINWIDPSHDYVIRSIPVEWYNEAFIGSDSRIYTINSFQLKIYSLTGEVLASLRPKRPAPEINPFPTILMEDPFYVSSGLKIPLAPSAEPDQIDYLTEEEWRSYRNSLDSILTQQQINLYPTQTHWKNEWFSVIKSHELLYDQLAYSLLFDQDKIGQSTISIRNYNWKVPQDQAKYEFIWDPISQTYLNLVEILSLINVPWEKALILPDGSILYWKTERELIHLT